MITVLLVLFTMAAALGLYPFLTYLSASGGKTFKIDESSELRLPAVERYRPMLRLLAEEDFSLAGANPAMRNRLRSRRRELLRGYLRCLTKDYSRLIGAVRFVMVHSSVDRPDLAKAIAHSHYAFALSLYRIEVRLQLHALGLSSVDVSSLVERLEGLRAQASLIASPLAA